MTVIETTVPSTPDGTSTTSPAGGRTVLAFAEERPDLVVRGTLIGLLVATAILYLWGLSASGWANPFYSAAAQAGAENWTAWFFGSLDAGNSITVDKPPAAIWLMALSVRLFGLNSWSILVPEALLGVASVGVLYAALRRTLRRWRTAEGQTDPLSQRGAHWAALAGAAVFALTPAAVLMFRFNNPDALLVFTMVLASYFTVRATESASRTWLVLAGVAIGVGFLTKMLQAFLVLPALVVAYAIAAPASWRKRITDLLAAFAAMIVSIGWYATIVELTPASMRPFIGGSQSNSLLELIVSYNGLGRITGDEVGSVGGNGGTWGSTGLTRMFDGVSGGMVSWLIPAALVLAVAALLITRLRSARQSVSLESAEPAGASAGTALSPVTHTAQGSPHAALDAGLVIWLGWLVVTASVFSFMAGIYHDYYTVALAPAIGGAVGLGGAVLWAHRGRLAARAVLAGVSVGTGAWALLLLMRAGDSYYALGWAAAVLGAVAAIGLLFADRLPRALAASALGAALVAGLVGPAAYAVDTAATPHTGSIVTAGPVSAGSGRAGTRPQDGRPGGRQAPAGDGTASPPGGTTAPAGSGQGNQTGMGGLLGGAAVSTDVATLLSDKAAEYTWVAATVGSQNAASYQLATGEPVMAIGGFNGSDPSPTLAQFQALVAQGRIHYFLGGELGGRQTGGAEAADEISEWVVATFAPTTVGGTTVYDLTAE